MGGRSGGGSSPSVAPSFFTYISYIGSRYGSAVACCTSDSSTTFFVSCSASSLGVVVSRRMWRDEGSGMMEKIKATERPRWISTTRTLMAPTNVFPCLLQHWSKGSGSGRGGC